ncbi:MAG: hypothetical protein KDK34_20925 [Leptospiraceae bacterium]|nr:hypothetical protein [Leptospiraceae bacterium]
MQTAMTQIHEVQLARERGMHVLRHRIAELEQELRDRSGLESEFPCPGEPNPTLAAKTVELERYLDFLAWLTGQALDGAPPATSRLDSAAN